MDPHRKLGQRNGPDNICEYQSLVKITFVKDNQRNKALFHFQTKFVRTTSSY